MKLQPSAQAADGGDKAENAPTGCRPCPKESLGAVPRQDGDSQAQRAGSTYGQILKSSVLIGGSSAVNIVIGIVRTKAMAVLLGPAGFGLMGAFTAIADMARSVVAMGVSNSGVRQIAESVSSGDAEKIALTVLVLRRTSLVLGLCGALLLMFFSSPISTLTFGTRDHAWGVALLSIAIFFRLVAEGQGALLQGMRRIGDMAKVAMFGSVLGTVAGIPLIYWLRQDGIVPSLIAVSCASALATWWYSRKVRINRPAASHAEVKVEVRSLLKLGLAFMASGLLMMGAAYAVRIILIRHAGLEAAGLYQSAWTVGGLYVGFVLQAMSADFYPRLVGAISDHAVANRLVNEQAHISLLLAGVGVLATISFAPVVLHLLYSADFAGAIETLRWICLGMMLRVITWPMGYIIVARGVQKIFFLTEVAWTAVNVGLSLLLVNWMGAKGAGIAFFASYIFHGLMIYPIARHMTGFRWSAENVRTAAWILSLVAVVFLSFYVLSAPLAIAVGCLATAIAAIHSVYTLMNLVGDEALPAGLTRRLRRLREFFALIDRRIDSATSHKP